MTLAAARSRAPTTRWRRFSGAGDTACRRRPTPDSRMLYVDEKGAPPELIAKLADEFGVIGQVYY